MGQRHGFDHFRPNCELLESRENPANLIWLEQSFDDTPPGSLPAEWRQWNSRGTGQFEVSAAAAWDGRQSLSSRNSMPQASRAWINQVFPADFGIAAHFLLNSPQPMQLFARGSNVDGFLPTYYAVSLTRGLRLELLRVVNGHARTLAVVQTNVPLNNSWVRVALKPVGSQIAVQLFRHDTGQFLNARGSWQSAQTDAILVEDDAIPGGGFMGIHRPDRNGGAVFVDQVQVLAPNGRESFDTTPPRSLPRGWSEWSSHASAAFRTSSATSFSPQQSLASNSTVSTATARAWLSQTAPQNVQVAASVPLDSAIPLRLLVRGSRLDSPAPSYYALNITRGVEVAIICCDKGTVTELAKIRSNTYVSNVWVRASLTVVDDRLHAVVYRLDTGQFLRPDGQWQTGFIRALDVQDRRITGAGFIGLERPALYAGTVSVDDFEMSTADGDVTPPVVRIDSPSPGATVTGAIVVRSTATDAGTIDRTEFWIQGQLRHVTTQNPAEWNLDSTTLANGRQTILVRAYDLAGNVGQAEIEIQVRNDSVPPPTIPRHYPHIRIAMLAYSGTPFTEYEYRLLRESVDLVIPHPQYLKLIDDRAPNTPQLLYTNVSNIYGSLLTDWLAFADANGFDREAAFYHASQPIAWSGASPASMPVNWFWAVFRGADMSRLTDLTGASRNSAAGDTPFGTLGESLFLGYPERFREVNFNLFLGRSNGWSGVFEYVSKVDSLGRPTEWKPLNLNLDTTQLLARSGRIEFDPPRDWRPSRIGNSPSLYYIRIRTTQGGNPPVGTSILGRNYSQSNGASSPRGIIPVFDTAADVNNDGYLNDAEYARRAAGKDARFLYESRVFYPHYGEQRFVVNPSSPELRSWFVDYHVRFLDQHRLADGLFVDNSGGRFPLTNQPLVEPSQSYAEDYAGLLNAINRRIFPRWLAANTAGGGAETDAVVRQVPMWFEEFAIRPLAHNYSQFLDLAAMLKRRQSVKTPAPYVVLDTLPTGGSPTDPRTLLASLAYYYLLADPNHTFLLLNGGFRPNSSWSEHWVPAAAYNIGRPRGEFSLFASGKDPGNGQLTYHVYQREYDHALVLYKPLSYTPGRGNGTLADGTATVHALNGSYRILNALGQLSAPVTSVRLRNGEGVILIKT